MDFNKNGTSMIDKVRIAALLVLAAAAMDAGTVWAQPQAFRLTADQSSVHFDAKSTLHPFSGDTRTLSGEMIWDDEAGRLFDGAVVRVPVGPILTGEPKRDGEMRKMFAASEFPDIEFRASKVVPIPSSSGRYRLEGTLKIRRVERPVVFDVTVTQAASGSLEISGETLVRTDWFELKPPSVLGLVRVLPEVKVRFKSVWEKA